MTTGFGLATTAIKNSPGQNGKWTTYQERLPDNVDEGLCSLKTLHTTGSTILTGP